MAISYSGVVGHTSKVTLPSVSSWGTNMNILRDPPKSIQTRKIDKVGQTSDITQMIQESGDRACENISTYARGVNPMVSVSYDNYGNNGGQRTLGNATQAFLPYRIMNGGAFRPPARDQRELLPLSRQPRLATTCFSQPGFADFSKKAACPHFEDPRAIKKDWQMLRACAIPTAVYKIETPVTETYEVKNLIKNPLHITATTGKRTNVRMSTENYADPTREIKENPLHVSAVTNLGGVSKRNGDVSVPVEQYTRNIPVKETYTNASRNIQVLSIDELYNMNTDSRTKDVLQAPHNTNKNGVVMKHQYIHEAPELSRNIPLHEAQTNLGSREFQRYEEITARDRKLRPTVSSGEYTPNVGYPMVYQENHLIDFDQTKSDMRKKIYDMQQERYGK